MAEGKKVSLKLMVDTKGHKVMFAEAGKDFVDFLFQIMSLPLSTVTKLLTEKGMVGSLGDLHKSLESLSPDYLLENFNKDSVLKPITCVCVPLLSLNNNSPTTMKKFYKCGGYYYNCTRNYVSDSNGIKCPCGSSMSTEMTYVGPTGDITNPSNNNGSCGYVKGLGISYMVMDNLEVKPMSTISSINTLNKLNVKDISSLVEKEVQVGLKEGVALLKASLETQTVLTTVFLGRKRKI